MLLLSFARSHNQLSMGQCFATRTTTYILAYMEGGNEDCIGSKSQICTTRQFSQKHDWTSELQRATLLPECHVGLANHQELSTVPTPRRCPHQGNALETEPLRSAGPLGPLLSKSFTPSLVGQAPQTYRENLIFSIHENHMKTQTNQL